MSGSATGGLWIVTIKEKKKHVRFLITFLFNFNRAHKFYGSIVCAVLHRQLKDLTKLYAKLLKVCFFLLLLLLEWNTTDLLHLKLVSNGKKRQWFEMQIMDQIKSSTKLVWNLKKLLHITFIYVFSVGFIRFFFVWSLLNDWNNRVQNNSVQRF